MKYILSSLILLSTVVFAQNKPEPTVLFLTPSQVVASDDISEYLKAYDKETDITDEMRKNYIPENLAPNWKTIREKELDYISHQNFSVVLVIALSRELTYHEIVDHDTSLIYPVKTTVTPGKVAYKKVADEHYVSWVVNIPKVTLQQTEGNKKLTIDLQLYNAVTDRIFLTKTYQISSAAVENCDDDMWACMIEKIKLGITDDLTNIIERNRHHHRD